MSTGEERDHTGRTREDYADYLGRWLEEEDRREREERRTQHDPTLDGLFRLRANIDRRSESNSSQHLVDARTALDRIIRLLGGES